MSVAVGVRAGRSPSAGRTEKSQGQRSGRGPSAPPDGGGERQGCRERPAQVRRPDGQANRTAPLTGATRAPGAARRREPTPRSPVPVAEADAGPTPLPAVPQRPAQPLAAVHSTAPTPPQVSGHGGLHRPPGARRRDHGGADRVIHSGAPYSVGSAVHPGNRCARCGPSAHRCAGRGCGAFPPTAPPHHRAAPAGRVGVAATPTCSTRWRVQRVTAHRMRCARRSPP